MKNMVVRCSTSKCRGPFHWLEKLPKTGWIPVFVKPLNHFSHILTVGFKILVVVNRNRKHLWLIRLNVCKCACTVKYFKVSWWCKKFLACENHYTLLYVTMHLIPAAVTEESVGPAGSGWHLYDPNSPCSCSEKFPPDLTAPFHLHPLGNICIHMHNITSHEECIAIGQTQAALLAHWPKVILHFSNHVQ